MLASRRGFTLIELLVAVAIASFIIAGLYGVFILQSRQLMRQDLQMEMHQNLRFATDLVSRTVRMAGYNTSGLVAGYMGESSDDDYLPAILSHDGEGPDSTDALTIVYGDPSLQVSTTMLQLMECGTSELAFLPGLGGQSEKLAEYESGDLIVCLDYSAIGGMESYLWVVSDVDTSSSSTMTYIDVSSNSAYLDYSEVCPTDENLTPVMSCAKGMVVTYYIDNEADGIGPGTSEHPVLMMDLDMDWPSADDVPLVENIEDFQVAFCLNDGSDTTDCSLSTSWTGDDDAASVDSTNFTSSTEPWMVRVSMVGRSSRDDPADLHPGQNMSLENHTVTSSEDYYYRQVISSEVTVRNLRMQSVL